MVDFMDEAEPIIHVRAWQPDKFNDGSTISIYDFEIIEWAEWTFFLVFFFHGFFTANPFPRHRRMTGENVFWILRSPGKF